MMAAIYPDPASINRVAVIGTGSVGASWAALFMAHGLEVIAFDPAPQAETRAHEFIGGAWPALKALGYTHAEHPDWTQLRFADSAARAAETAQVVQENTPEREVLKAAMLTEISEATPADTIILSSTGGIPPSVMQTSCRHPERLVVLHPFNPAHLIPLVEVVGGEQTDPRVVQWALDFARRLGKHPIQLNVEASGHLANRLQFALMREAVACLLEGMASARDIDAAVRYGLGPRWTLMGGLMTLHLAGGPGGMQGILDHAGDAIEQWWTPSVAPQLTEAVRTRLTDAASEVSEGQPVDAWVRWRDEGLVQTLRLQRTLEAASPAHTGDTP